MPWLTQLRQASETPLPALSLLGPEACLYMALYKQCFLPGTGLLSVTQKLWLGQREW